ncbi:GNAT family N-acetyltransferase [Streptomyces sp. PU_AKi4]|uniref:GNAT family N-acetyltransferase n=1 Tax=Streptomyces sp. PU_AKi4 TaxID=2800809 RepID=UPI003525F35E
MSAAKRTSVAVPVSVRPLVEPDLDRADEIFRVAFGTFLGLPEPETFFGTADYVRTRWAADPRAAFAATVEGEVVGSNFAADWGSVGYFGPLTVRPDLWDRGIGRRLMEPVMDRFDTWENRHLGLFTFSHSPKHLELYRRYGFWPRFLTAVMRKRVTVSAVVPGRVLYGELTAAERPDALGLARALTGAVHEGLSLEREITAVQAQGLGDTVLLEGAGSGLDGLAVWPSATAERGRRPARTCASSSSAPYAPARTPRTGSNDCWTRASNWPPRRGWGNWTPERIWPARTPTGAWPTAVSAPGCRA